MTLPICKHSGRFFVLLYSVLPQDAISDENMPEVECGCNVQDVIQRHPLHTVAQLVSYTDAFSKSNMVLKTGQVGRRVFDCYVFQCHSEVTVSTHTMKQLIVGLC